jgi:hypothetical protein
MRHAFHLVASILMWILFGWYWYLVMQRQVSGTSLRAVGLLLIVSLLGLLGTMAWVAHNKRLAARNRRRGSPPVVSELLTTDHIGRPLAGTEAAFLKDAKVVVVSVDAQGRKVLAAAQGVRD